MSNEFFRLRRNKKHDWSLHAPILWGEHEDADRVGDEVARRLGVSLEELNALKQPKSDQN